MNSHAVCRLDQLADPGSRAFQIGSGDWPFEGFIVRQGSDVYAYENVCPHRNFPLNWQGDRFLDRTGSQIICSAHGARFELDTGACFFGPCVGRSLRALAARVENGQVIVELAIDEAVVEPDRAIPSDRSDPTG